MDAEKYGRSVTLICSTCGSSDFEYDKAVDDGPVRCTSCDETFFRNELVQENGAVIKANVDEVKADIVSDARKEFSDFLCKGFSGSKHIKFR